MTDKLRDNAKKTIIKYLNRNYLVINGTVYIRKKNSILIPLGNHDIVKKTMSSSGLDMNFTIEIINEWFLAQTI